MTTRPEWFNKQKDMRCHLSEIVSHTKLGPAAAGADAVVQKGLGGCSRLGTQAPRGFNMQNKAALNYASTTPKLPMP